MEVLMDRMGWTKADFALASELQSAAQAAALCDDKIDAFVFTVGHPAGSIEEAPTTCDVPFPMVNNPNIDKLLDEKHYNSYATIQPSKNVVQRTGCSGLVDLGGWCNI